MNRPDLLVALMLCSGLLIPGSAPRAENGITSGKLSHAVEIPAHRWLARIRELPEALLDPFSTDGCSGGMSSLWVYTAEQFPAFAEAHEGVPPWEACCVSHDRVYHTGGADSDPEISYAARVTADRELQRCVAATASERDEVLQEHYAMSQTQVRRVYAAIASAMYQAVRLGGGPCTGLPWRWGYGYPHCWEIPRD